ncbi:MAG: cytochrome c-type biogenesis protein [Acidimicrobiales bacterium]
MGGRRLMGGRRSRGERVAAGHGDAGEPQTGTGGLHRADRLGAGWWPWLAMAVVAVVALALGSGLGGGSGRSSSPSARAARLDARLRCPSCVDLSVAQSDATTAVAIRHYVAAQVKAGESDVHIVSYLEGRYGRSILLSPPASGSGAAVWWIPAGLGVGLVGGLVVLFARRARRVPPAGPSDEDRALVDSALREGI